MALFPNRSPHSPPQEGEPHPNLPPPLDADSIIVSRSGCYHMVSESDFVRSEKEITTLSEDQRVFAAVCDASDAILSGDATNRHDAIQTALNRYSIHFRAPSIVEFVSDVVDDQ